MTQRFLTRALLTLATTLILAAPAAARDLTARPFTDLWIFGDSLSDSGNRLAETGGLLPPSPPYFQGRASDGPTWVEHLALLLDLDVDFDSNVFADPLARNQAFFAALSGFGDGLGRNFGLRSQVESFLAAGGRIGGDDLVIVWGGANNYLFGINPDPAIVVTNLLAVVHRAAEAGGRRFLIVNLPLLGDTPGGQVDPAGLNALTETHNALLAKSARLLRRFTRLEIAFFDVNAAFEQLLQHPEIFGFSDVTRSCIVQQPDGSRPPSGLCPPLGDTFDSSGFFFWDLVHPSAEGHRRIALAAHSALIALQARARHRPLQLAEDGEGD